FKDFHGLLSSIDPAIIGGIEFYSGVTPSRYGERLSGVLEIAPRAWQGTATAELGLSLLYAHALTAGRSVEHGIDWLAAVRQSAVQAVLDLTEQRIGEPSFVDALARVAVPLGERAELVVGLLSLDDRIDANLSAGTETARADYRDRTGWSRVRYRFDSGAVGTVSIAHSDRHSRRSGVLARPGSVIGSLRDERGFDDWTIRGEIALPRRERWWLRFGAEWARHDADYDIERTAQFQPLLAAALGRDAELADSARLALDGRRDAIYGTFAAQLAARVRLDIGARLDRWDFATIERRSRLSPRIAAEYRWPDDTTLRLSWGLTVQAQRPDELQIADGESALSAPQVARQFVAALERRFTDTAVVRIEAFDKRLSPVQPIYENLFDPVALLPEIDIDRVRVAPRAARVYGVEVSARWQPRRVWTAWMSYSWSEATDEFDAFKAPRSWHQRHAFLLGGGWIGPPWQLSASLLWRSGWQRNELRLTRLNNDARVLTVLGPRNGTHWNDYLSLDLRASWNKSLRHGALKAFAEVTNATNRINTCCTRYRLIETPEGLQLEARESGWAPLLPMIGLTWRFP
ncbi:MAG: TonB-dependent receptor, partial [Steroidobacteraceae bacterium]|nr:TonB-dependent receptor [Steroidobacteraceae bacterium]MDW8259850.1 TonB-dependent receptor [Gammaproteobacteria bacterium]